MLQPIRVDTPFFFPYCCAECRSATGPLVDTHIEDAGGNRIYHCASCVRLHAIALGYLEGDEHERLLAAAEHESETAKALAAMTKKRDKAVEETKRQAALIAEFVENNTFLEGRVLQLEAAISEDAKAKLALVNP